MLPVGEHAELIGDLAGVLVDGGQVDLCVELDLGRLLGVVLAAGDVQGIDAVVEVGVGRADDHAVPVGERLIGAVDEAVTDTLVRLLSVLGFLKLLVEPERSGHGHFNNKLRA